MFKGNKVRRLTVGKTRSISFLSKTWQEMSIPTFAVFCGDVMGDADAGVSIKRGSVDGSVAAGVSVTVTK